ncbi:MAG: hypothetical protein LQ341_001642 [Variospora aurantia]|nr:MAG: hypothetical protein LQ341_001642 [Variospora aurantia]
MSRSNGRTFSFDNNDESSLNGQHDFSRSRDVHLSAYSTSPPRRRESSPPDPPDHRSPYRPPHGTNSNVNPPPTRLRGEQRSNDGYRDGDLSYSTSSGTTSTTTPGVDNMAASAAGGGIAGIAFGVANTHERDSGVEALRSLESLPQNSRGLPPERGYGIGAENPYVPEPLRNGRSLPAHDPFATPAPSTHNPFEDKRQSASRGSLTPTQSRHSIPLYEYLPDSSARYSDNPYSRVSTAWDPRVSRADIDPNTIDDDDNDGVGQPLPQRKSMLGLRSNSNQNHPATAAAGGVAAGGVLGTIGGLVGRNNPASRDASGQYNPVGQSGLEDSNVEKSEWLSNQTSGRKRLRWLLGILLGLILIGAIVGGVIGGIQASKNHKAAPSGSDIPQTAADDDGRGDLDKDSAEIKKLLKNPNLHKVFPGVDYTPYATQYPDCLKWPPSQNNVTRDVAVLSQLTNSIRLYGTDCNQTEMVLHAIDKLGLTDFKLWLGVWLDRNQTTNARGLAHMNDLLTKHGAGPFLGVVVGNEALYREDLTETELAKILTDVKSNLTALNIDLPLATSDLGDAWTPTLASEVDVVMSNIHPFFAGKTSDIAADWTWSFWKTHNAILTANTNKKNIISEVGWPSEGGKHCGEVNCTAGITGAVAGIDEMNEFMDTFVCQSLANGTEFFWFEAFDEPWKKGFNEPEIGKNWEDKWGLMDLARDLKPGVKIPDCGGKTVS